jgi:AraC family transcriptional regulator, regulatory protein of adaptative response / methylphosphotriester-DNA alkyltransferase methyltransferase
MVLQLTDEKWQAIVLNDSNYNDKFIYAVKTTGIFCRPSCKSRPPKKENVFIFENTEEALSANFRPCKRCKPTGERLPDREWVSIITSYIDKHYCEKLTLERLADISHGSPYHLHRTFKRITQLTPVEYILETRMTKAKELLLEPKKSISDVARDIGIPNISYFITLFKKKTGQTPIEYRQKLSEVPYCD